MLLDSPDHLFTQNDRYILDNPRFRLISRKERAELAEKAQHIVLTTICQRCGYSVHTTLQEGRQWFQDHRKECT